MNDNLMVKILPQQAMYFLNDDGTFNMDKALLLSGKYAGVCYNKEGFSALENEDIEKTMKRANATLRNGHHSVFDHIYITFNFINIPKILAMVLNNENEYTTSEKSLRYTPIQRKYNSSISKEEKYLYYKWVDIFKGEISYLYGNDFSSRQIEKLAGENARYLVSVFVPTQMIYTTSLRQINYIASFMERYMKDTTIDDDFSMRLAFSMKEFVERLNSLGVLHEGLMNNEKNRRLSLFGNNLDRKDEFFGDIYATHYDASFACYAQAQRHRTINYQLERRDTLDYYIPPILKDGPLEGEWLHDIRSLDFVYPQGELVSVYENGKYDDFILKCKERLCSHAQLEIMNRDRDTLLKYKGMLEEKNHYLKDDISKYANGARCTFPDYNCNQDCKFKEGKTLVRKI